jgi:two-component system phosphate regulon sensor histidine kinase PhoR
MAFFVFVLLFFLFVQGYLIYSLKKPFLLASALSFFIVIISGYILLKIVTQPVGDLVDTLKRLTAGPFKKKAQVYSRDELSHLARAISELEIQLRNKIDEISKERDYLQTVLKGMAEGVLVVDERGRILLTNNALQQLLSLPSNVANRTPLEIIRNAELEEAIRKVIREGNSISFELNLPLPLGKAFEVNVVGILPSPEEIESGDEGIRGVIAVFHDITRLKELEKIRQDFVANVSHELRTPLTTIKGYVETLLDGALKEEVAFQFVQIIKKHSDRLTKIVEDLLALSKIETKGFYLNLEKISIHELIDDVINFVREAAEKKKISVTKKDVSPSLSALADRAYLEQVLVNLCDNAIKYGREGGGIALSAIEKVYGEVEFSVRDNGIGIPKEDLPRIFERFYRVDKGRSQDLGGTGLGLSIVKHLVQAHGGKVWAESQLEKGSTFYFTMPAYPSPHPSPPRREG